MNQSITIHIDGMTCGACVSSVTQALNSVAGVDRCDVSLQNNHAKVDFDGNLTSAQQLVNVIEAIGFDAKLA